VSVVERRLVVVSEATAVIEVHPFAERLRYKGGTIRFTPDGQTWRDYRVTRVSMPDHWGRCTLTLEAVA
jgi:hypothetical protein